MGTCITPFTVKHPQKGNVPVPCGRCPNCLKRRISGWSFRLIQHEKQCETAHFITLTYDTAHVPITKKGFMTLNKKDVQLFFKRLRKLNEKKNNPLKISYYLCGEYGGKTCRPHYHIILYNAIVETVQTSWSLGDIHYGEVNGASIGYTLKYMSKPKRIPMHANDDRAPEFSLMSKGLGKNYIDPRTRKWHIADLENRMYIPIEDGKKIAMPRYYKDKLYDELQRKRIAFFNKQKAEQEREKFEREGVAKHGHDWERVKVSMDKHKFQKFKNSQNGRDKI